MTKNLVYDFTITSVMTYLIYKEIIDSVQRLFVRLDGNLVAQ